MKIIRAEHLGMCFGVKDAIALALETAQQQPLTILGDLVHNQTVLAELEQQGIEFRSDAKEVGTGTVMITAHGASERKLGAVRERGLQVLEARAFRGALIDAIAAAADRSRELDKP